MSFLDAGLYEISKRVFKICSLPYGLTQTTCFWEISVLSIYDLKIYTICFAVDCGS